MKKVLFIIFFIWVIGIYTVSFSTPLEPLPFQTAIAVKKANRLLAEEKYDQAVELLTTFQEKQKNVSHKKAIKKGYAHYMVDFTLGNARLMQNKLEKALRHYKASTQKAPDFSPGFLNLAKCYYDLNLPDDAAFAFLKAYETASEKKGKILYYSVVCFMMADQYPRALEFSQKLFDSHKSEITSEWKETFARIYITVDMQKEALPFVKELSETLEGEKQQMWREVLIYLYVQLHMDKKALSYAGYLTQVDPLTPKWRKAYAHLLIREEKYKEALSHLTTYSYLTPLSREENKLLGDINFTVNIPIQAVRFYEKAMNENKDPDILTKIAQGYMRLYEPQKALDWVKKGLEKKEDRELLMLKSYLLYETEQFEEAFSSYKNLTEIDPENGQPWLMVGYCAWQLERIDAAETAFKNALRIKGYRKQAEDLIKHLKNYKSQK